VDINSFIHAYFATFPQIFAEKRYKLINFAPKLGMVDKLSLLFCIREKQSTVGVNNCESQ
jgi:hypothetical protein